MENAAERRALDLGKVAAIDEALARADDGNQGCGHGHPAISSDTRADPSSAVLATDAPATSADAGRLPTFTPPAPEIRPTLLPAQGVTVQSGFPPAILITVLFVLGGFGGVLTIFRSRR